MRSNTHPLITGHNAKLKVCICQEVIPVSECHMDNRRKVADLQLFSGEHEGQERGDAPSSSTWRTPLKDFLTAVLGLPGPDGEGGSGPGHTAISKHSFTWNQIVLGVTGKSNSGGFNVQGQKEREKGLPEKKEP